MSDYILRESALNAFDGELEITGTKNKNAVMKFLQRGFHNIRKLPAADVVEVVRCKDCKHKRRYKFPPKYDERDYCSINERVVTADDFCSWAERRTDEIN